MPKALQKTTGTMVAFGDVVQLSKARSQDPEADGFERYIGLEHLEPSNLKVSRWGEISDGVTFTSVFRPGQVLFGKRRAYQRKVAVAEFSGVCSGDIYVLEPKGEQLLRELLPFICQSEPFYDYVISMSQGGLSPRVNWKALAKYEFALPPLEDQRRIAAIISSIDAAIHSYEAVKNSLEQSIRALGKAAFECSETQAIQPLKDLVTKLGSGKTPTGGARVYQESGIVFLRSQNVYPDGLRLDDVAFISSEIDNEMSNTRVFKNDVLLNISGASIGRCTIYNRSEQANVNQHVCILRADPGLLDPRYLTLFLQSEYGQDLVDKFSTNGNRQGLNFQQLGKFPIPVSRIALQLQVGETFDSLRQGLASCTKRTANLHGVRRNALNHVVGATS